MHTHTRTRTRTRTHTHTKHKQADTQEDNPLMWVPMGWPNDLNAHLPLGEGKDWLTQCQDNVIEWDMSSWYWRPDLAVGQHYKAATIAHGHKSLPLLISP